MQSLLFKPPPSKLLTLPAEIRTLIFEFAITNDKPTVTFRLDSYQRDSYTQAVQPALTRVSRQIRHESLPLYYELNDFVLHSEAPKAHDALAWLRCNEGHLGSLRRLEFWVRYVPLTNQRAAAQGAMQVALVRARRDGAWAVSEEWKWITVVRKPGEVDGDAKFLLGKMRELVGEWRGRVPGPEDLSAFMVDLRGLYVQEKMS